MKDLDYFIDNKSFADLTQNFDLSLLKQSSFGFHIGGDSGKWFDFLEKNLQAGQNFPLQIMSGPALTLRYFSSLPDSLVRMIKTQKVLLCVHLPFVVTMYKPYEQLKYQRDAFKELSDYYRSLGILDRIYVLFHCSHPEFNEEGNLHVQWAYWKDIAEKNLASFLLYFPNLLIENLVGYRNQPMDVSSPNGLWKELLRGSTLQNKVGLALDTEHLYGSGNTLRGLNPELLPHIRFIHCNASPANALFGAYVDLHSYTSISSSLAREIGPFMHDESTLYDYYALNLDKIPAVFERKYMSLQIDDLKTMLSFKS